MQLKHVFVLRFLQPVFNVQLLTLTMSYVEAVQMCSAIQLEQVTWTRRTQRRDM
jgi:hypothetical protein